MHHIKIASEECIAMFADLKNGYSVIYTYLPCQSQLPFDGNLGMDVNDMR